MTEPPGGRGEAGAAAADSAAGSRSHTKESERIRSCSCFSCYGKKEEKRGGRG